MCRISTGTKCLRGLGRSCTVSDASEFGGDTSEFNARFVSPTQEDADEQPCG